jgi:hypothetical protein
MLEGICKGIHCKVVRTGGLACDNCSGIIHPWTLFDTWINVGKVFFTATAVFALEGISHSMGLHLADVPLQNLVPAMQVCVDIFNIIGADLWTDFSSTGLLWNLLMF